VRGLRQHEWVQLTLGKLPYPPVGDTHSRWDLNKSEIWVKPRTIPLR
jgi:hypothetical protein